MTITFHEAECDQSPLWDFGWFDVTRFRFTCADILHASDSDVIRELTAAPIYQRSFCESPDPWGVAIERHGPFHFQKLSPNWYTQIPIESVMARVAAVINDSGFDNPPSLDQMTQIKAWAEAAKMRGDAIFMMEAPDDETIRVEWSSIWFVFAEFMTINRDRGEMTVAVIGYD